MTENRAAESMTRSLVTIRFDRPIEEAYELMEQWRVRHLPVKDQEGHIVGMLADSDVFRAMNPRRPGFAEGLTVADFMSWPVISVTEDTPLSKVAEAMVTEKVSAFLVTSGEGDTVGIVTSEDLLKVLQRVLTGAHANAEADAGVGTGAGAEAAAPVGAQGESAPGLRAVPYNPVVQEALRELQSVGL